MTRDQANQLIRDAHRLLDGLPHSRYHGDALDRLQRILEHYDYFLAPSRDERLRWWQRHGYKCRRYIARLHDRLRSANAQYRIEADRRIELSRALAKHRLALNDVTLELVKK